MVRLLKSIKQKYHVLRKHLKEKPFKCQECNYASADRFAVIKHAKRERENVLAFECTEYLSDGWTISKCECTSSDLGSLKRHIKSVHDKIRDTVCSQCNFASSRTADLNKHIQVKHTNEETIEDEEQAEFFRTKANHLWT